MDRRHILANIEKYKVLNDTDKKKELDKKFKL